METNLVLFNKYKSSAIELKEAVENTEINSLQDMEMATGLLRRIQASKKEIDGIKKHLKQPIIDLGKEIEATYKDIIAPFDEIKGELTAKQVEYQKRLDAERIKREEEEEKKLAEKKKIVGDDEEINDILDKSSDERLKGIDREFDRSKQRGYYEDYEIKSVDIFNIDKQYLNIKPLEVKADILAIKKALKEGKEIEFVEYEKVGKVK